MPADSSSQAVAKLLARQPEQPWLFRPSNNPLLVVNPDGSALCDLSDSAWCFHAGHASHWPHAFCQPQCPDLTDYQGILLVVAKEQPLNQHILEQLRSFAVDKPIWLVGEKKGGISSLVKKLPAGYQQARKIASGNHCQLFETSRQVAEPAADWHQQLHSIDIALSDQQFAVQSLPGVFSKNRLDAGTRLLLETLPKSLPTSIVDFACGNGVIAKAISLRQQATLTLCDVNPMATAAAELTMGSDPASGSHHVVLADGLPKSLPPQQCIVSNPPFHTGLKTDYEIARKFIQDGYNLLCNGGELYIVANRFLPWPEVIERLFGCCNTLADDGKFRVYFAQKSGAKSPS